MIKIIIAFICAYLSVCVAHSQDPSSILKGIAADAVDSSNTNQMKQRISQLHKIQADFIKKVAEGKVKPFETRRNELKQNAAKIAQVKQDYTKYLSFKEGSDQRTEAAASLQKLVDEVGQFLLHADHPLGVDNTVTLTAKQVAEIEKVEAAIMKVRDTPTDPESRLLVVGPNERSTLLYLPVPITVQAPKKAKVYLRSIAGGGFESGSPVIEREADENGLINTAWISRGDGVADCQIEIIAEGVPEDEWMTIRVVQPLPIELPTL